MAEFYDYHANHFQIANIKTESLKLDMLSLEKLKIKLFSLRPNALEEIKKKAVYVVIRNIYTGNRLFIGEIENVRKTSSFYEAEIVSFLKMFDTDFAFSLRTAPRDPLEDVILALSDAIEGFIKRYYGKYPTACIPVTPPPGIYPFILKIREQALPPARNFPHAAYDKPMGLNNLYECMVDLFQLLSLVPEFKLDMESEHYGFELELHYVLNDYKNRKTLDARLPNILSVEYKDAGHQSTNLITFINESTYPKDGSVDAWIRSRDGTVKKLSDVGVENVDYIKQEVTYIAGQNWNNGYLAAEAQKILVEQSYEKTVLIELKSDDLIYPFGTFDLGEIVTIKTAEDSVDLKLTAYELKSNTVVYTFGNGRETLTQKLEAERRKKVK